MKAKRGRADAHAPTRRSFLAAVGGALVTPLTGLVSERPAADTPYPTPAAGHDPRLTARPGVPIESPTPGPTHLGSPGGRGAILYVPASYEPARPAPLVVALHGSGGAAGRWTHLYERAERLGFVLLAPESRGPTWDRVHGLFGPDVAFIDEALRATFARCAVDPGHVALAGFSDGASYALSLGPSNGDLFTHLIAWSPGFSDPEDPIVGDPRVWVSHGTDDPVLSVVGTRSALVPMFEMDGYDIEYVEFEGRHEMPDAIVDRALEWFLG